MTPIAISMRVAYHPDRQETRDALETSWWGLLAQCGVLPVPLPNHKAMAMALVRHAKPQGLILTGGGDIDQLGGQDHHRTAMEKAVLAHMVRLGLPVLGVCRGMQLLATHIDGQGTRFVKRPAHIAQRHGLACQGTGKAPREVNSFHAFAIQQVGPAWEVAATCPTGTIEAIRHRHHNLHGCMWHPEREQPADPLDLKEIQTIFNTQ